MVSWVANRCVALQNVMGVGSTPHPRGWGWTPPPAGLSRFTNSGQGFTSAPKEFFLGTVVGGAADPPPYQAYSHSPGRFPSSGLGQGKSQQRSFFLQSCVAFFLCRVFFCVAFFLRRVFLKVCVAFRWGCLPTRSSEAVGGDASPEGDGLGPVKAVAPGRPLAAVADLSFPRQKTDGHPQVQRTADDLEF